MTWLHTKVRKYAKTENWFLWVMYLLLWPDISRQCWPNQELCHDCCCCATLNVLKIWVWWHAGCDTMKQVLSEASGDSLSKHQATQPLQWNALTAPLRWLHIVLGLDRPLAGSFSHDILLGVEREQHTSALMSRVVEFRGRGSDARVTNTWMRWN